jgi:hypothetical protein
MLMISQRPCENEDSGSVESRFCISNKLLSDADVLVQAPGWYWRPCKSWQRPEMLLWLPHCLTPPGPFMRITLHPEPSFSHSTNSCCDREKTCRLSLSEPDFLHLTLCPPIAFNYLQITWCHFSLWLSKLHGICIFLIHRTSGSGLFP